MADSIEVSVTHEIKVDGEKSWVGGRYTTEIQENENAKQAYARAGRVVDEAVLSQIQSTVAAVQSFTN